MAWLITQHGFISAVEYRPKKDRTNQLPDSLKSPAELLADDAQRKPAERRYAPGVTPSETRSQRRRRERLSKHGFILARARVRDDLEQLRPYFSDLTIVKDGGADYKWRAVVPRMAFSRWGADIALGIDYDSHFKEVTKERSPYAPGRYSSMMSAWSALNRMDSEPTKYGSGTGWSSGKGKSSTSTPFGHGNKSKQDEKLDFDWDQFDTLQNLPDDDVPTRDIVPSITVIKMARLLLKHPVEKIDVEGTSEDAFDFWCEAYNVTEGEHDSVMTVAQVVDVLEGLADQAEVKGFKHSSTMFKAAATLIKADDNKTPVTGKKG